MESIQTSPFRDRRAARLVFAAVLLGFLALISAATIAALSVQRTAVHASWVEHTYEVEREVADLRLLIERLEVQRRGYLLTGLPRFAQNFRDTVRREPALIATIRAATADNPRQQVRIAKIEQLAARHVRLLAASVSLSHHDPGAAITTFESDGSIDATRALRRYTESMVAEEEGLLAVRSAAQARGARTVYASLAVCGVLLLAMAASSLIVLRRYTHDLIASRDAMRALNETLEEHVAERTRDLSRANEEIQRFAYIVSHDLRSPLVNVMGFTGELEAAARPLAALVEAAEREAPQLVSEDARLAAREDLPESIRFIRTSTQKMDRLINAILRLSREGKRVLTPEPLDLGAIADAIVASLQHRLDELGAQIRVERPMPALTADRLAVEQMLSNLVENAVKYLAPGRPGRIVVSARAEAGRVLIDVADNGRGIDPRDHDRIFDLFRRSGQQDQPGEGIGLAHVRALAYRLGGLIGCRSMPDRGSTFTLSLPAEPVG